MFREQHRGRALSIMGMIPFIAPVLGPSIGSVISQAMGWRWTFWITAIIAGPLQLLFLLTYRETYRVRILQVKAAKLRKKTGNFLLKSRYEYGKEDRSTSAIVGEILSRPLRLLIHSPLVLLVGACGAVGMSLVYVIITSLPEIYRTSIISLKAWLA
jgi:MFS family permease